MSLMTRFRLLAIATATVAAASAAAVHVATAHPAAPVATITCVYVGPLSYGGAQLLQQVGVCLPTP